MLTTNVLLPVPIVILLMLEIGLNPAPVAPTPPLVPGKPVAPVAPSYPVAPV